MTAFWARHGIVPSLRWGYVALTVFMIGDGIESGFLSPYLDTHGFGSGQISLPWGVYELVVAVAAWLSGALAEAFGPRRVMLAGLAIWVVFEVAFLAALAQGDFTWMLVSLGVRILHFLGGHTADVAGDRAVAQTKMTISQRAGVDGVEVDVVCTGRFYDFCRRRGRDRTIVRRQPIYEKDRLDPVDPPALLELDHALLDRFRSGYRHLGYVQTKAGFTVRTALPGLTGPAVQYDEGAQRLAGSARPGLPA